MTIQKKYSTRRIPIWLGLMGLLIAPLVFVLTSIAYYRLRGPTEEQQVALALLRHDYRPTQGVNAFPLFFYLSYDVPDDQLDARMTVEVDKFRKWREWHATHPNSSPYEIDAPPLPELSQTEKAALCNRKSPHCLAQVAAQRTAVRAVLAAHPRMVARAQAFEHTDFLWDESPRHMLSPSPRFADGGVDLWLSALALKYVEGDRSGALAATCRHLAAWRRMTRGSNSLLEIASARMDSTLLLFADMLADLPAGTIVPDDCAQALQPVVAADVDRCAGAAGEFALMESMYNDAAGTENKDKDATAAFFDKRQTIAWEAQRLAVACGNEAASRLLADEPLLHREAPRVVGTFLTIPPGANGLECIGNFTGCLLYGVTPFDNNYFSTASRDHAAHLRLAAALLWLREHLEGSVADRFARRPAQLRSPNHESGFDEKQGVLYVENLHAYASSEKKRRFELPVALR